MDKKQEFTTKQLSEIHGEDEYRAPDLSYIRKFQDVRYGGLCHCTLPPKATSKAKVHKTVDEIWYCIQGQGEVWRKLSEREETVTVRPDVCLTIPVGTHFQFRNTGREPLIFIIATMPPWPGSSEAVNVDDHWTWGMVLDKTDT